MLRSAPPGSAREISSPNLRANGVGATESTQNLDRGSPPGRESRPAGNRTAEDLSSGSGSSVSDLAAIAEHIDGAIVAVVTTPAGRYRRRTFLTLAAAERAVQRAQERGQDATIVLAELRPVFHVVGTSVRPARGVVS